MQKQILEILNGIRPDVDFENEKLLIDNSILDSFDIIAIVGEFNDTFDIDIDVEDLEPVNFNTVEAMQELNIMIEAEREIVNSTMQAYQENDLETARKIKPFSAAVSTLCEILEARHIGRLTRGECSIRQGAEFNELLNCFERIASHCVTISGIVRRNYDGNPDYHVHSMSARELSTEEYNEYYEDFLKRYDVIMKVERPISIEDEAVQ